VTTRLAGRPIARPARAVALVLLALLSGCSLVSPPGLQGAHVRVVGLWSGPELTSFETVKSVWERETGATVDWQGTRDVPGAIAAARQTDAPPDVAILPNLAMMDRLAADGQLIPIDSVLDMTALGKDYARSWLDLGSRDGKLFGLFYKVTSKATVWYDPKAFTTAGYTVPATWDEMIALADRIVADGHSPFSIVAPSGPAQGWALTDWVSAIVLEACGPDIYDQWIAAKIAWTDTCIRQSFERFASIASTERYVLGGTERILETGDDAAADPLYSDPPDAYLCYLASFAGAFIAAKHPGLQPGADYDVFAFPTIREGQPRAVTIGADVPVLLRDTPAARSFLAYLAGARAQEAWIKLGGFTSVNRSVSLDSYRDPVARSVAEQLNAADVSRFSAGDMMPTALQRAWWAAMVELVQDPTKLDGILERMTALAKAGA
jgi:alpha-glucoside transport system substrate-binding protein